jgi:hypothetical protein
MRNFIMLRSRPTLFVLPCLLLISSVAFAEKGTSIEPVLNKPGTVAVEESFTGSALAKPWIVAKGNWSIQDGSLAGREKKEDMHAAVLTMQQPHRNSIMKFSFKLDGATGVNLSFNHAKGHLFRIAINPTGLTITKDKGKKDPNSKVVPLGKIDGKIGAGQWHTMLVETQGDKVFAKTDSGLQLEVREPALDVEKTGYRFVMRGDFLLLDDVKVWQVAP